MQHSNSRLLRATAISLFLSSLAGGVEAKCYTYSDGSTRCTAGFSLVLRGAIGVVATLVILGLIGLFYFIRKRRMNRQANLHNVAMTKLDNYLTKPQTQNPGAASGVPRPPGVQTNQPYPNQPQPHAQYPYQQPPGIPGQGQGQGQYQQPSPYLQPHATGTPPPIPQGPQASYAYNHNTGGYNGAPTPIGDYSTRPISVEYNPYGNSPAPGTPSRFQAPLHPQYANNSFSGAPGAGTVNK